MTPVTPEEALELLAPQPKPAGGRGDVNAEIARNPAFREFAALFEVRGEQGVEWYGEPLRRGNGRDSVCDAVQEAVDGLGYSEASADSDATGEECRLLEIMCTGFAVALAAGVELHRLRVARGAK